MAYYHICPDCGAALDPGETCDCKRGAFTVQKINGLEEIKLTEERKIWNTSSMNRLPPAFTLTPA